MAGWKQRPVSYCYIGIKDSNIGAVSDANGNYSLIIPYDVNQKIIFSAVGLFERSASKEELMENATIIMAPNPIVLEGVVIS